MGCILLTLGVTGCGNGRPKVVPVAGRVLIDGQPLTCGAIRVIPDGARSASAKIQSDGTFQLTTFEPNDGCAPGNHKVEVVGYELLNNFTVRSWHAPVSYSDSETSGLTLAVNEPTDEATINLSWGKDKPFKENLIKSTESGQKRAAGTY